MTVYYDKFQLKSSLKFCLVSTLCLLRIYSGKFELQNCPVQPGPLFQLFLLPASYVTDKFKLILPWISTPRTHKMSQLVSPEAVGTWSSWNLRLFRKQILYSPWSSEPLLSPVTAYRTSSSPRLRVSPGQVSDLQQNSDTGRGTSAPADKSTRTGSYEKEWK